MSDLSRRDFLKVSAVGIAAAGAGNLLLTDAAQAQPEIKSQCPPDPPYRDEGYIICPSDSPEQGREYSALIQMIGTQEYVRMAGVDCYPFDGSYWETDDPLSTTEPNFFFCRSICNEVAYDAREDGAPVAFPPPGPLGSYALGISQRARKAPKPPLPRIIRKDPDALKIVIDQWDILSEPSTPKLFWAQVLLYHTDKNGNIRRPTKTPKPYKKQSSANREVILQGQDADAYDVFGQQFERKGLLKETYYIVTEAIFDYGKDEGNYRYRGNNSYLKVNLKVPTHEQWEERPK